MPPVKLAVIGLGLMGSRHVEIVQSFDGCDLVGVCDLDENLREIADRHDIPFFQDIGEMLDRTKPDGAILATQSAAHVETFEACARRGIHTLIEKPVADTTEAALRIAELADATNTKVLVGHHRRHNPLIKATHSIVTGGEIGDLLAVSMMWTLMKPNGYFDIAWRSVRPDGGPVLINLVHELDILRYMCGEIDQVFAQGRSTARGFEVEDSVSISVTFQQRGRCHDRGKRCDDGSVVVRGHDRRKPAVLQRPRKLLLLHGDRRRAGLPSNGVVEILRPRMSRLAAPDREDRRGRQTGRLPYGPTGALLRRGSWNAAAARRCSRRRALPGCCSRSTRVDIDEQACPTVHRQRMTKPCLRVSHP